MKTEDKLDAEVESFVVIIQKAAWNKIPYVLFRWTKESFNLRKKKVIAIQSSFR